MSRSQFLLAVVVLLATGCSGKSGGGGPPGPERPEVTVSEGVGLAVETVELKFAPEKGDGYVVHYHTTTDWDYVPEHDSKGRIETSFSLAVSYTEFNEEGKTLAQGEFLEVSHVSRYMTSKIDAKDRVVWSKEKGIIVAEGEGHAPERIEREAKAGVRLFMDVKGVTDPGGS
ncbi:MAG: hypothetical protein ACYTFG_21045 [Planctomycetota bacterium]|jgi:hypothetical protein